MFFSTNTSKIKIKLRFILILGLLSFLVLGWSRPGNIRWLAYRSFEVFYEAFDPWTEKSKTTLGPPKHLTSRHSTACISLRVGLEKSFPRSVIKTSPHQNEISLDDEIPFQHENTSHPRFQDFIQKSRLVREAASSPFELSQRVRKLTFHGKDDLPITPTDPLRYLAFAENDKKLTCRYFAVLFGAIALADGYSYRLLGLSPDGREYAHAVTEVYLPDCGKWVLIDPDFNIAYKIGGEWANALDLHRAWQKVKQKLTSNNVSSPDFSSELQVHRDAENIGVLSGVSVEVLGDAGKRLRATNMLKGSCTGINLELFEYVFYSVGNDYLSAEYPIAHPLRSKQYILQEDSLSPPPPVCPEGYILDVPETIYWPIGRTKGCFDSLAGDVITIHFSTYTPNFSHFEVQTDQDKSWRRQAKSTFLWRIHSRKNTLRVRSVNSQGLAGEEQSWEFSQDGVE